MATNESVSTVIGHDIIKRWGKSDVPDTPCNRDRLFNMTKFVEDFSVFDGLCHGLGFDTSESIALYNCFITNEIRGVLE